MESIADFLHFLPASFLALAGLVLILIDAYRKNLNLTYWGSVLSLLVATVLAFLDIQKTETTAFSEMIAVGGSHSYGALVVLIGALFSTVISKEYLTAINHHIGEVYALILFATVGMLTLAAANDLLMVFIGLETMSICLYVLAGLVREQKTGVEAALKYFILGAFSTGFFLYGIALIYGATGTTMLTAIAAASPSGPLFWAGVGLLFVGFMFKVSAVPFHMWTPDVYQGAPTTITAFMATASKSATFISLMLILNRALPDVSGTWVLVLQVLAAFTMVVGNLIALAQDNIKRMLAYSSIAHAGYILVGLSSANTDGTQAVLYYLMAYTIMNIGAFGVVAYYERQHGLDFTSVENYAGLGYRHRLMGLFMSIFMFSLVGIPPMAGFIGKYLIVLSVLTSGHTWLALLLVLASAASAYYYIRVLVFLYMRQPKHATESFEQPGMLYQAAIFVLALAVILMGILPGQVMDLFIIG
jgi:NADH-quinone oxidoreductase subunit N